MSKSDDKLIARAATSGVIKAVAYQLAIWASPFVIAAITLVVGRVGGGVEWMWAIMAASLTFSGVATGTLAVFLLAGKRAIEGKLVCESVRVVVDIKSGAPCVGVNLHSLSDVPIEIELDRMRTEISGNYASTKPFTTSILIVPPRGYAFFNDHSIKIDLQDGQSEVKEGSLLASIRYGSPGNRKYELEIKRGINLRFDGSGKIESHTWFEVA